MTTPTIQAGWLDSSTTDMERAIVIAALESVGVLEMPPGSNRSPTIDAWVTAVGSPLGSYWCAAAVSAWFRAGGAEIPPTNAGATKAWQHWALLTNRWSAKPRPGSAILYGDSQHVPDHIGVVIRVTPLLLTVEGNTSFSQFDANGVGVTVHEVGDQTLTRVLGFIRPSPIIGAPA